jgi:hypothetical protein
MLLAGRIVGKFPESTNVLPLVRSASLGFFGCLLSNVWPGLVFERRPTLQIDGRLCGKSPQARFCTSVPVQEIQTRSPLRYTAWQMRAVQCTEGRDSSLDRQGSISTLTFNHSATAPSFLDFQANVLTPFNARMFDLRFSDD